jgi:hypothetical protein
VDARKPINTGTLLVALARFGNRPNEINAGSVTADPLLTTVFKNPPTTPANSSNTYPK